MTVAVVIYLTPYSIITSSVRVVRCRPRDVYVYGQEPIIGSCYGTFYVSIHHPPTKDSRCIPKKMAEDPSNSRLRTNAELRERLLEKVQLNITETGKLGQQLLKSSRSHEVTGC